MTGGFEEIILILNAMQKFWSIGGGLFLTFVLFLYILVVLPNKYVSKSDIEKRFPYENGSKLVVRHGELKEIIERHEAECAKLNSARLDAISERLDRIESRLDEVVRVIMGRLEK